MSLPDAEVLFDSEEYKDERLKFLTDQLENGPFNIILKFGDVEKTVKVWSFPKSSCSKCYGRGFRYYNLTTQSFHLCNCVLKVPKEQ